MCVMRSDGPEAAPAITMQPIAHMYRGSAVLEKGFRFVPDMCFALHPRGIPHKSCLVI